ncbi:NmrA family NAD(P)-binding protein [Hanstruepera flava]|uniref:NmrA family NAD(P)-binding protein n=1 Tax=Hanstruepera flava TaxID=2930218 RepID=UPI002027A5D1|nr:NmrA family NAD(P)-binding protein [Hanstruepera flava]
MAKTLITGATGNIGFQVIRFLLQTKTSNQIIAGVRNIDKAKLIFQDHQNLEFVRFDLGDPNTYDEALEDVDKIFLLRPPQITDINRYFRPFILRIRNRKILKLVFLSVQGADRSKIIPHYKIEQLIKSQNLNYIFLRPSYFMQNLTTTLYQDIKTKRQIILPAGKAKFNWIDINNIGEVAAFVLNNFEAHSNRVYDITGLENKSFYEVTQLINSEISNNIIYKSVNPIHFLILKMKAGMSFGKTMVLIILHYLPRFQKEPKISNNYEVLMGKEPTTLQSFIEREKKLFED